MLDRIRELQHSINRTGLGATSKSVPTPRMLISEESEVTVDPIHRLFVEIVSDQGIVAVSRDLFVSGFYAQAVEEAFKYVDNAVKKKCRSASSGVKLMEWALSPNTPILQLNGLVSQSEQDEQAGYHRLFAGSMLGVRNPCAHENNWITDAMAALEVIVFAQHLLRKVHAATVASSP